MIGPNISAFYNVTPAPLAACHGDSLTYGQGLSAGQDYPAQLLVLLGISWRKQNLGFPGETVTQLAADVATQVDVLYRSSRRLNCYLCWGGANDLGNGKTGAALHTEYAALCSARRALGFKVLAFTVTPSQRVGVIAGRETERQAFNTLVRANYTTYADRLVDVGGDSRIGDFADALDTTYYQSDQIHLTTAGQAVVAGLAYTQLSAL